MTFGSIGSVHKKWDGMWGLAEVLIVQLVLRTLRSDRLCVLSGS
uniref:Uncharacterized protein n=1 Tax=Rhizophora mucronata TaxID=61149 RepID=A0A2P2PT22_RHIMU